MGRTVRELEETMDAAEWNHWVAYHAIDPWGEERADLRAGIVAATTVNVHGGKGRAKPSDFMPKFDRAVAEPQTDEQMKRVSLQINAMFGGTVS